MADLRILVVGASIAGPAAAYWFNKAGAQITVIERFPVLRTNGQSIDIRNVGVTVMRKMAGMEDAIKAKLNQMEGIGFVDETGKPFAVMKASGDPDQQSLVSEYEIFRGDLSCILYDMTKDSERVKYVFGEQVASMQQRADGPVTVEFLNGYPTQDYDLVVACDGATSRTRALGFNCGVRDHIVPLNCWAAYCTIAQDLVQGSRIGLGHTAVGGRFMALGLADSESKRNTATLMKIYPRKAKDATLEFQKVQKEGTEALKKYVATEYEGAGWCIDEILSGIEESDDFYASEIVSVKMPTLHRGRFVLVGDAGYAGGFTGMGTSLALCGAYLLAGEVLKHKGDLKAGLQAFDERMKPLVNEMQRIPPGITIFMAPQTAWGIWARNWIFTLIAWGMGFGKHFAWLGPVIASWSQSFGKDKHELPEYEWVY
jgi:2-polyprenyl-6-methoxyphenol hydroxylase-like FAD-dependent oxidoreductase